MMTRFSASAWSTALIDFSRETDSGTMMNGKMTRSLSGSTGRTSGILIASSFAVSFASVIEGLSLVQWMSQGTVVSDQWPVTGDRGGSSRAGTASITDH